MSDEFLLKQNLQAECACPFLNLIDFKELSFTELG